VVRVAVGGTLSTTIWVASFTAAAGETLPAKSVKEPLARVGFTPPELQLDTVTVAERPSAATTGAPNTQPEATGAVAVLLKSLATKVLGLIGSLKVTLKVIGAAPVGLLIVPTAARPAIAGERSTVTVLTTLAAGPLASPVLAVTEFRASVTITVPSLQFASERVAVEVAVVPLAGALSVFTQPVAVPVITKALAVTSMTLSEKVTV
jgi:hypothetical protein